MHLTLRVISRAKQDKVQQIDETHFKVWVTATAEKGKANNAVIRLLAEYFDVPQSSITIKRGATAKTKLIAIEK